jgi:hypothetical protein
MIRSRLLLLIILFCADAAAGQTTISPATGIPNPEFDWLYSKSIPPEARVQLLPLYRREAALVRELNDVKWRSATDTLGGLASAAAGVARAANSSPTNALAEEAAARAGQPDAQFRGTNAALSAQRGVPGAMYPSVRRGQEIIGELASLREQIGALRQQYRIVTIGPATVRPAQLSDAAIAKIMADAARRTAEPVVGVPPWGASTAVPANGYEGSNVPSFKPPLPNSPEYAAWKENEQKVAKETVRARTSAKPATSATGNDAGGIVLDPSSLKNKDTDEDLAALIRKAEEQAAEAQKNPKKKGGPN